MERSTILRTSRLVLTTWSWADLDDLHLMHSDPVTMRYVRSGRPESRAETTDLLARYIDEQRQRGWTKWRIADDHGALAGRAGFGAHQDQWELSYTIRRALWGRGLATEIAAALADWHRANSTDAGPLWAHVAVANPASARVLGKVGFVRDGRAMINNEPCDSYVLDRAG